MSVFKKIILSLSILIGISGLLTYLTYDGSTVRSFVKWFLIYTTAQVIIHYGVTYVIDLFMLEKIRQKELEVLQASVDSQTYLTCPCEKKHHQAVELNFNKDNTYTCEMCSKRVSVKVDVTTALKTDTAAVEKLPDLLKKIEENINQQV